MHAVPGLDVLGMGSSMVVTVLSPGLQGLRVGRDTSSEWVTIQDLDRRLVGEGGKAVEL